MKINALNNTRIFFNLFTILILIGTLICFSFRNNDSYSFIFYLPLSFLIFHLFSKRIFFKLWSSIVYNLIYLQMFIRYILISVCISLGLKFNAGFVSTNSDLAIFLIIYEMIFVFLSFAIVAKSYNAINNKNSYISFFPKNILLYVLLMIGFLYFVIHQDFLKRINFVWNLSDFVNADPDQIKTANSFDSLFFFRYRVLLIIVFVGVLWRSKVLSGNQKWLFSFLIVLLNATIIVGTSRFSMLYVSFPFILILTNLYPQYKGRVIKFGIIFLLFLIFISSVLKFSTKDSKASMDDILSANSLNAYFSGPGNIATGIDMYELQIDKSERLSYILNDMFQNVPIASHYTISSRQTNSKFNYSIYGNTFISDQIVPVLVSSLVHFGYFLSFIYTFICVLAAFYFEKMAKKVNFIASKYILYLFAFNCSMVMMINISSIFSNIISHFLFTLIPFYAFYKGLILIKKR